MKQILLAIDGNVPSRPIFKYAADLCRHISARLCILQFIKNRKERALNADSLNRMGGMVRNIEIGGRGMSGRSDNRPAEISGPLKTCLNIRIVRFPIPLH